MNQRTRKRRTGKELQERYNQEIHRRQKTSSEEKWENTLHSEREEVDQR